jgi:hypothetical protein
MRTALALLAILLAIRLVAPVAAHHSFAAEFDAEKPVTLRGSVTKVDWRNPHIWVSLDARNPDGSVTPWECEGTAPNVLTRHGWNRHTLKVGDEVIVQGYRAKNGTTTCNASTWKMADGRTIFTGAFADGRPESAVPAR